ncbi:probable glutathione S-transferase [Papaver somniferum]|uniref:probable glutathione S-transferase n=1 Tax=Papaver somniferum TaxID=3469 RepID=UPI000E704DB9|nr:probable glutathione S-transferase [Papaver somniferum]
MEDLKLFGVWYSPFVCRVKCALQLKGLNHEYIEEDLSNKSDLLLQYNPVHKKIPILVHAGKPIVESLIILEYIDETWPDKYPLLPKDPYERSKARFWGNFLQDKESTFWSLVLVRASTFEFSRTIAVALTEETKEKTVNEVVEVLRTLEEHGLGDKKFFVGDDIGFTDLAIGIGIHWMKVVEELKEVKIFETCTRLQAWIARFNEVPAVKEGLPSYNELVTHYKSRWG